MFLLLLLLIAAESYAGDPQLSDFVTKKAFQDAFASTKMLTEYITKESWKKIIGIPLDIPTAIDTSLDDKHVAEIEKIQQKVEKMRSDINNAVLEASDICAGILLEEISTRAGALSSLLIQAELGLLLGEDIFVEIFVKACEKVNLILDMNEVAVLLSKDSNPLTTAIEADPYHKYTTIDRARTRIVLTVNTLASAYAHRLLYMLNDSKYEWNTDAVFNKTQMIYKQLDEIISNYQAVGFVKNFKPKVKPMIASIIEKYPKKDDKYKAAALMSALSEIHTRDRFVVVVYSASCRLITIVSALDENVIIDEQHRAIVYRSQKAYNMTEHQEDEELVVMKAPTDPQYKYFSCSEVGAYNISRATTQSGFVLIDNECGMVIVQDERLKLKKHRLQCLSRFRGMPEDFNYTVYSYPL